MAATDCVECVTVARDADGAWVGVVPFRREGVQAVLLSPQGGAQPAAKRARLEGAPAAADEARTPQPSPPVAAEHDPARAALERECAALKARLEALQAELRDRGESTRAGDSCASASSTSACCAPWTTRRAAWRTTRGLGG